MSEEEKKKKLDTTTVAVDFVLTAEQARIGDWQSRELNPVAMLVRDKLIDDVVFYVDLRPEEYFLTPREDPRMSEAWKLLPDDLTSSLTLLRDGELPEIRFTLWLPKWAIAQ